MEKYAFEQGARIILDGKRYKLLNEVVIAGVETWEMVPLTASSNPTSLPIVHHHSKADLHNWLGVGRLAFDDERDDDTKETLDRRRRRRATLLSEKAEVHKNRIGYRRDVLKGIEERLGRGKTSAIVVDGQKTNDTLLKTTLIELGRVLGLKYFGKAKRPCPATYYRWKQEYEVANDARDLEGYFDQRGNRQQLLGVVKDAIQKVMSDKLDAAAKKRVGGKPTVTMNDIMVDSVKRIGKLKLEHPALADSIRTPSKTTFYNILNANFSAELISKALHGSSRTKKDFRRPFGHEEPFACLSELQYDETLLPVYCFDDVLQIPLGRPWLAWLVDVYSAAIVGFYCGFEPPGDVVFTSVLRHAALPKSYVRQCYPDIQGSYPMAGFGRKVTFDNSLSAHGRTIERIFGDLDLVYDFTGPRMPWLKGDVEGTFKVLNETLLSEMPGFVLSDQIDRADYDPTKNGSIGFLHLLWILHHYLIDVRHEHAPPGFGASPNKLWEEGIRIVKPQFPRANEDLDFLFGIEREGRRLDHRGVLFEGLRYYSEGVDILRRRDGASLSVRVKVNPLNLGRLHVYDKDEQFWIECYAIEQSYAAGLDLHRHRLYRRHAERLSGSTNLEARIRARIHLHEIIKNSASDAISIRNNALIARAAGIGTHAIFNLLDHQGNLSILASQFAAGRTLQDVPLAGFGPSNSIKMEKQSAPVAPAAMPNAEVGRRRVLPVFATDKSLRPAQ